MGFDVKTRLSQLRGSAKARNIKIDLDVNKYQDLVDRGCYYCGIDLKAEKGYCLDRIDSKKGYVISNLVGCCKKCNIAKSDMSFYDFSEWINRVHSQMHINKIFSECLAQAGNNWDQWDKDYHNSFKDKEDRGRVQFNKRPSEE